MWENCLELQSTVKQLHEKNKQKYPLKQSYYSWQHLKLVIRIFKKLHSCKMIHY